MREKSKDKKELQKEPTVEAQPVARHVLSPFEEMDPLFDSILIG